MTIIDTGHVSRPPSDRAMLGAVYTPDTLGRWVASLVSATATHSVRRILDPAAGDGALLRAAQAQLGTVNFMAGVDISPAAVTAARQRLVAARVQVIAGDALLLDSTDLPSVDAVIMNPPWGATLDAAVDSVHKARYELASGQFDSWDLFVEWSIRTQRPGTVVAAILPDSLFLPEHQRTRRLLLEATRLNYVARLGEGWFPGVYRGTVVVVYVVGGPSKGVAKALNLERDARLRVLAGTSDLASETSNNWHEVDMDEWASSPRAEFRIPTVPEDPEWLQLMEARGGAWSNWFDVSRGVEIGKRGQLYACQHCGWHRGPSRSDVCGRCGAAGNWIAVQAVAEVSHGKDWVPLIVGSDVTRYKAQPSAWLRTNLDGIAYKNPAVYRQDKILIRKTGLGINAAVDTSGSYTNQVVFQYSAKEGTPTWVLFYAVGVLNSRALLGAHLARTGELQWRSHPYVTPRVLATLPIPVPANPEQVSLAEQVAESAQLAHSGSNRRNLEAEHRVDALVAELFGLGAGGERWLGQVFERAQSLKAFAHLRQGPPTPREGAP